MKKAVRENVLTLKVIHTSKKFEKRCNSNFLQCIFCINYQGNQRGTSKAELQQWKIPLVIVKIKLLSLSVNQHRVYIGYNTTYGTLR